MNERTQRFREAIHGFIEARREAKLKDGPPDPAQASKYEYEAWVDDAAKRVGQIQSVTHVLKATHPNAKGSSLHVRPSDLEPCTEVGSHALGGDYAEDIVGNAAALDVYKLLKLEVDGRRLLDWMEDEDGDLLAALSPDPIIAAERMVAFHGLLRPQGEFASHANAKQLYWCTGSNAADDDDYHLLQPMFPSSLLHAVDAEIRNARFGEEVKTIRDARRKREPHDGVEPDYRGLGMRKLGGTKPQNISQLNSERGGINYLLASLPPRWKQDRPRQFLHISSAIPRIRFAEGMPELLDAYVAHIKSYDQRRMDDDNTRRHFEKQLGIMLAVYGVTTAQLFEPGWTRAPECELALCEKLWLDPGRFDLSPRDVDADPAGHADDLEFQREFQKQDWPDQIAERFAQWLDDWLRRHDVPLGDVERRHLTRQAFIESVDWPNPMRRDLPSKRSWAGGQP